MKASLMNKAWLFSSVFLLVVTILLTACGGTEPTDQPVTDTPFPIETSVEPEATAAADVQPQATPTVGEPTPEPTRAATEIGSEASADQTLRAILASLEISPLDPGPAPDPAKVTLGQALFFDKVLGGGQVVACSTCHHPLHSTTDGIPLSIGVGGVGLGPDRTLGADRRFIRRNAPDLFNRGSPEWTTMFWDSRVSGLPEDGFDTPADEHLLPGLDSVLAAQAMFPVTSDQEMRSAAVADGRADDVAHLSGDALVGIWRGLMDRVLAIPEYRELFAEAYPDVPTEQIGFQHVANALAAFQIESFTFLNSPWDRYVQGDEDALSDDAKRGALLFFGKAGCIRCHAGNLFTDQQHHNVAVPQLAQLGNNPLADPRLDIGRALESRDHADTLAFRTPPLRNVELTGPWMHDGVYATLESAARHMLNPSESLQNYDPGQLPPLVQPLVQDEQPSIDFILETLDPLVADPVELSEAEFDDLLAFLLVLTDPAARDLKGTIPESVPSGLPIED